ncbi:MAG: hypothetical protein J6X33_10110 [Clostridiales bacterium]|nr:hypothetical protein [Clostridiales bacterium]
MFIFPRASYAGTVPDGFVSEGGKTYYYKDGVRVTGWVSYKGERFYFYRSSSTSSGISHSKGAMATGWQLIDGEKFYFYCSSKTLSGEPHTKGAMATGWQTIDGNRFYFYRSSKTASGDPHTRGAMATGWQTIDGEKFYFYKTAATYGRSGVMASGAVNIEEKGYVFAKTGKLLAKDMHGWYKVGGDYYFCDRKTGKLACNKTVNCIKIGEDGKAVMDKYAEEKIPVMIRARQIIEQICDKDDTLKDKQWKCYEYVAAPPYLFKCYPLKKYRDKFACYTAIYANNILNAYGDQKKIGGDCVTESAALGYLYNELDFGTVYLCDDGGHAWIMVGDRTWDPLFVEAKGKQWYNRKGYAYRFLNKTEI